MANSPAANNWFLFPQSNPAARLRLFCFPYAGGGAPVFWNWHEHLPFEVEVCLAQLPGRGRRLLEAPFTQMLPLAETIAEAILPYTDKPFAFFGHSMGAIISFELARLLRESRGLEPVHLFASGARAPQLRATDHCTFDWPEEEFVADLRRLNGTPKEVLDHPELMRLVLPLLRADFELIQTYAYAGGPPLSCPITALCGLQDEEVSRKQAEGWREQTNGAFICRMFPGDHFFIHASQALVLQSLAQDLHGALGRLS